VVNWEALNTPLGLPGQRRGICVRTSFVPLREGLAPKEAEVHYYATDLQRGHAGPAMLAGIIRGHWGIENKLHHPKDRTWLEDRHWVKNKKTGGILTMLRSVACALVRRARLPGLDPKAHCPERIEHFSRSPHLAVAQLKGGARL
jgi:hypothetical protein